MALRKEDIAPNAQQTDKTKKRSRITFDVSPELRRRIKLAALQDNLSVGEYVSRILEEAVPEETSTVERKWHPIPDDFLERVYRVRERVIQDSKGELFEDSTELIRQMREERTRELMGEE